MSGIEAAGLALAIFPIVMKGLKYAIENLETVKSMRKFTQLLSHYVLQIDSESTIYETTLERLLLTARVCKSEAHLNRLLADPLGPSWKHPDLEATLQRFLDRQYSVFTEWMLTLTKALKYLEQKLTPSGGPASGDGLQALYARYRQVRLWKKEFNSQISCIEKANIKLSTFTDQNAILEDWRSASRASTSSKPGVRYPGTDFAHTRKQYIDLHTAIQRSRLWDCQCQRRHGASTRLEFMPGKAHGTRSQDEVEAARQRRRLLLGRSHLKDLNSDFTYREFDIATVQVEPRMKPPILRPVPERTVYEPHTTRQKEEPNVQGTDNVRIVNDICSMCFDSHDEYKNVSSGYLESPDTNPILKAFKHYMFPQDRDDNTTLISLSSLLSPDTQSLPNQRLFRGDRLFIAIVLAMSLVQLGDTPWIGRFWTSEDVFFFRKKSSRMRDLAVNEIYPYLTLDISSINARFNDIFDATSTEAAFVRSKPVFALGLILVELCLGQSLSKLHNQNESEGRTGKRFLTAIDHLDDVESEESDTYRRVVTKCLYSNFEGEHFDLNDEEFREVVYREVVQPLFGIFEQFNGHGHTLRKRANINQP